MCSINMFSVYHISNGRCSSKQGCLHSLYCLRVTCSLMELDVITDCAHSPGNILMGAGNFGHVQANHVLNLLWLCELWWHFMLISSRLPQLPFIRVSRDAFSFLGNSLYNIHYKFIFLFFVSSSQQASPNLLWGERRENGVNGAGA